MWSIQIWAIYIWIKSLVILIGLLCVVICLVVMAWLYVPWTLSWRNLCVQIVPKYCWYELVYLLFTSCFNLGCNISSTNQFIPVHSKILDTDLGTNMTSVVSNSRSKVHNWNSRIIVNQKNNWLGRATGNVKVFFLIETAGGVPYLFFSFFFNTENTRIQLYKDNRKQKSTRHLGPKWKKKN
jgi:hypothetical protein